MARNIVDEYGWRDADETQAAGYITSVVIKELRSIKARRVLDFGAGNGALCARLKSEGFEVVGVELDESGAGIARHAHPDIPFYRAGTEDDPAHLSEAPFDAVVSTEVIEHLYAPHRLLAYASGVLKSDGHLMLSTPYHGYLKNLALCVFDKWDHHHDPLWTGGHIKFWSRNTPSKLLAGNGFQVTRFAGAGRLPYLWCSMVITAVNTATTLPQAR